MNPPNRYLNILSAVFTPTNGPNNNAPMTLLGVQSMTVGEGANLLKAAGDGDVGPSTILIDSIEPVVGLKFEDIEPAALAPLTGLRGTLVVVNGLAGPGKQIGASGTAGALQATLGPCVAMTKSINAAYRKFSDCDVEFHGICAQGNPLAWTTVAASQMEPPVPGAPSAVPVGLAAQTPGGGI